MIYEYLYKKITNRYARKILLQLIAKHDGGYAYSSQVRTLYSKIHHIQIGYGTYGGCFELNNIPENVSFGNYCSIASGVRIFRANHPLDKFTTHPLLYNPSMGGNVTKDQLVRPPLTIGHDVWIGANAIILPSVNSIGNGAIIGAGSVVTRNVDPYTIVAGNPAHIIKKRFTERQISIIENSRWWELDKNSLTSKITTLNALIEQAKNDH